MKTGSVHRPRPWTPAVLVAYALFVLVGLGAGANGVLLLAQIDDYGVDRTTIGATFFTGSAGFVVAGALAGPLVHRWGYRTTLIAGTGVFVLAGVCVATRPAFVVFVVLQVGVGFATGLIESVLNAYLAGLPRAATLLNRLHAFFGVGALLGPLLGAGMLRVTTWPIVVLTLAGVAVPLLVAVRLTYPAEPGIAAARGPSAEPAPVPGVGGAGLLRAALSRPAILLAATMLTLYVGLELGVGNWAYGYLVEARDLSDLQAGYAVSGYWLGLTLGRFLISPAAARRGITPVGTTYLCLGGISAMALVTWAAPYAAVAAVGLALLGFFLGPIFPTTMAVLPQLTSARLVPAAVGVVNAGSVVGGAALPWATGLVGEEVGAWTLLPIALVLGLLQLVVWWRTAAHVRRPVTPR